MDDDAWPEHLLAANHTTRSWNSRSDATWEAIRHDYLSGIPARDLCDRYEVALSTLRLKASEGGWRRADQADSDLFPADADRWVRGEGDDEPSESLDAVEDDSWADLADRARFRLRRAIASGRAAEAASWLRVHDRLRVHAAAEVTPPDPASVSPSTVEPGPDPLDAVTALAAQVADIARRAARATGQSDIDALEAEVDALQVPAAVLTPPSVGGDVEAAPVRLDPLDSLDPVFSDPSEAAPAPDRLALLRMRERRIGLGLGVADLDQRLADLDRAWTGTELSP